jgi:hypothetical protein
MDLIVMVMVNKIMHYHTSLPRLLLSSTLGAIWSVIAICIPDEYRLFVNWCTYLIITGLMLMIINSPLNIIKGSSGKINYVHQLTKSLYSSGIHIAMTDHIAPKVEESSRRGSDV